MLALVALGILLYEGAWNIYINSKFIQNEKPAMTDAKNELPVNRWVDQIDPEEYQAILPIPYFHVGSENIWIVSKQGIQEMSMIASLKTGLPTTGVQLSRTSIAQTFKNYAVVTEPFEALEIVKDLPNRKPFLLLFNRKHYANEDEARLIRSAKLVYQDENIEMRRLEVETLEAIHSNYIDTEQREWETAEWYEMGNYAVTDTAKLFKHWSFDKEARDNTYAGAGAFEYECGPWKNVLNDTLPLDLGKKYILSFWMNDFASDGHLRTILEFVQQDPKTNEVKNYFYSDAHRHIKGFHENWALIELHFETKSLNERIKLTVKNSILSNQKLLIDELVLREEGLDIVYTSDTVRMKNGRKLLFDFD